MEPRRLLFFAVVLLTCAGRALAQDAEHWALLPPDNVRSLHQACAGALKADGPWQPSAFDMEQLESHIRSVSMLQTDTCIAGSIADPERYYRQYIGIVLHGHTYIFINAFCQANSFPEWRTRYASAFGGAACFWTALYDPVLDQFSSLHINALD